MLGGGGDGVSHLFIVRVVIAHHQAFIVARMFRNSASHAGRRSRVTSRAWGTLSLGILLALILGLIARIPQSDIVLIAAIRCIGIRPSTWATGLLLGILLVAIRLLILLLGLGEVWVVGVLVLVI